MGKTIMISSHILTELSDLCTSVGIIEQGELVDSGTIEALEGRLRGRDHVEITLHEERSEALGLLRLSPHVRSAEMIDRTLSFDYDGKPEQFYQVVKLLTDNSVPIIDVRHETGDLESLFMELTRGDVQ